MKTTEYKEFLDDTNHLVDGKKQREEPFFYTDEDKKILDQVWDKAIQEKQTSKISEPQVA